MLKTTTPNVEGKQIVEYHGLVSGEAILGSGNMLMVSASGTAVTIK